MRFLAARFEKGKKAVEDLMEERHRYWQDGLPTGHAELLAFQSRVAGDRQPYLASKYGLMEHVFLVSCTRVCM